MNVAIIKAGGVGSRMGADIPKQFVEVYGKPIIIYTLEAFQRHKEIEAIWVICVDGWQEYVSEISAKYRITKLRGIVEGGETSLLSIKNGVDAVRKLYSDDDIILIHDANRPCVSGDIITGVINKCMENDMAVAAVPCDDEVALLNNSYELCADRYLDHKKIFRIQTPDAYKLKVIKKIFDCASEEQLHTIGATNVLAIEEGYNIWLSDGSATNIRLTTIHDINLMKGIFKSSRKR